jgi:hypothetical protein
MVDKMVSTKKSKKGGKVAGKKTLKKGAMKSHPLAKRPTLKPSLPMKNVPLPPKVVVRTPSPVAETIRREGTGFKVAVDRIEGETIIGDLIVVFPWTRETLFKHGLNLDVDEAGDIYMSLGAFAAIHGLKTESLVRELVEVSRQPPPPKPQAGPPTPQIAHATAPAV